MGAASKIEWTDHTFNPWIGCMEISPACDHCYARGLAGRYGWAQWGAGEPRKRTSPATWRNPHLWNKSAKAFRETNGHWPRVFCASLADVFDKDVPQSWRDDLFAVIRATPNLRWQLLTKRIGNAARMLPPDWPANFGHAGLMATIANQEEANRDIPKLLKTPAAWRGLSCEPLLGAIDLRNIRPDGINFTFNALTGRGEHLLGFKGQTERIDWVIAGGESGPGARICCPAWLLDLRDQCAAAGIPFFFKQWGEWVVFNDDMPWVPARGCAIRADGRISNDARNIRRWPLETKFWLMQRVGKKAAGRMLDGRTHDEFPNMERAAA